MAKVLITGATGLVGSHLLPLFGPEDEVHVLARQSLGSAVPDNMQVHRLDLGAPFDTGGLPVEIDAIIYLAQSENFRDFPDKASDIFEVNVASLMRLLDYGRRAGAKSFIYASSGGVYGAGEGRLSEESPVIATGAHGFYIATKMCGEILCESFAAHMNMVLLRVFFAYGAGQRRSMLIPRLVDTIRAGEPVSLQGEEGIRINPVHATDVAAACTAALGLKGLHRINIAGPDVVSLREICELIGARIGRAPKFEVSPGSGHPSLIADTSAMNELIGRPSGRLADKIGELL